MTFALSFRLTRWLFGRVCLARWPKTRALWTMALIVTVGVFACVGVVARRFR